MQHLHKPSPHATRAAARGMTLIEIMVVVAIIGLIVGGVAFAAFGQFKQAQLDQAAKDVKILQNGIELYQMQKRKCPKTLQDLKAAGTLDRIPNDPWGNEYVYKCPGEKLKNGVDVISPGPDKELGNQDDIANYDEDRPEAEE